MAAIKLSSSKSKRANAWIDKLYSRLPKNPLNPDEIGFVYGKGDDQQLAFFTLKPDMVDGDTAHISWFYTYPQKQGVGRRAIHDLQDLAKKDGIKLSLTSWTHGAVPKKILDKFYMNMGFKPGKKATGLLWDPKESDQNETSKIKESGISTIKRPIEMKIAEVTQLGKDTPTPTEIAKKYNINIDGVMEQLKTGVKIELEHTTKIDIARQIALDHLNEDLYYYIKLAQIEDK